MSAPPLIRPPTNSSSKNKFPSLTIPHSPNPGTAAVMGPDIVPPSAAQAIRHPSDNGQYLHAHPPPIMPSSSPSGYFSPEVLAAVNNTSTEPFPFPVQQNQTHRQNNSHQHLNISTSSIGIPEQPSNISINTSRSVAYISTEQNIQPPQQVSDLFLQKQHLQQRELWRRYQNADVNDLDEDDWKKVADAGLIEELGRLGEGAGGSVTRCKLRGGPTVFALKAITSNPNPELQKQILRELQFNRSCNSPHIVKYYGTFLNEELASIFIAMEYCGGGSLEAIYKRVKARGGRIGEKVLGKIAEGVLSGLSYLHERRIIHRDIKPQNILLDTQGQVKLCDFGVSGEVVNSLATTFTGTSYYMAPERIQGQPYTVTSDVWSLGLTIMEVAQHRFPFLPENHEPLMPIELLTVIVNMPAPELEDEPAEGIKWSQAFRHFLLCCLEKNPKNRASPRQMLRHPWIVGQSQKTVKMDKFVRECWM